MHTAKGLLVTLPCAYTRQRRHVELTCAPGTLLGVPGGGFAVRAGVLPHGKGSTAGRARRTATRTAHGKEDAARQRSAARQRGCRTAKIPRTAKGLPHGNVARARQRPLPCSFVRRTAMSSLPSMSLPCRRCRAWAHGKAFAGQNRLFAVRYVARQRRLLP